MLVSYPAATRTRRGKCNTVPRQFFIHPVERRRQTRPGCLAVSVRAIMSLEFTALSPNSSERCFACVRLRQFRFRDHVALLPQERLWGRLRQGRKRSTASVFTWSEA